MRLRFYAHCRQILFAQQAGRIPAMTHAMSERKFCAASSLRKRDASARA